MKSTLNLRNTIWLLMLLFTLRGVWAAVIRHDTALLSEKELITFEISILKSRLYRVDDDEATDSVNGHDAVGLCPKVSQSTKW